MTLATLATRGFRRQGMAERRARLCWESGTVVAVCGLHGGAGTTTVALSLATAIAHDGARVVLVEADPCGGALAARVGYGSPSSLADVVDALADRDGERVAELVATEHGVELVAPACRAPRLLDAARVTGAVLALAHQTGTCVVDCGTVRGGQAPGALAAASVVVWCADADRLDEVFPLLAGQLARQARAARWVLATRGGRPSRRALVAVRDDVDARIAIPDPSSAGRSVLDAVAGLLA